MWSLPSSWSFRMAPLMAVLYGESEVPRSFWGTSSVAALFDRHVAYFCETFATVTLRQSFPRIDISSAIPRAIHFLCNDALYSRDRSPHRYENRRRNFAQFYEIKHGWQTRLTRDLPTNDSQFSAVKITFDDKVPIELTCITLILLHMF